MGFLTSMAKQKLREAFHLSGLKHGKADMNAFLPFCQEKAPDLNIRGTAEEIIRLKKIAAFTAQSEVGREILQGCKKTNVKIAFMKTPFSKTGAFFHPPTNSIYIDPRGKDSDLVECLAHEGRHAVQRQRTELTFEQLERMSPESQMLQSRFEEADAHAVAGLVKAQLALKGADIIKPPNERLMSVGSYLVDKAYEHLARTRPESLSDGRALKTAFAQWVQQERSAPAYEVKEADYICEMITLSHEPNEMETPFNPEQVESICTVGGQNYLQAGAEKIDLTHPDYRAVAKQTYDRVSATAAQHHKKWGKKVKNDLMHAPLPSPTLPKEKFLALLKEKEEIVRPLPMVGMER